MMGPLLLRLALAALALGVGVLVASFLAGAANDALARRLVDPEVRTRAVELVEPLLRGVAALVALAVLGVPVGPVIVLLAAAAVLAGIAGRDALRDVVAGAWLLQVRPFRTGDVVQIGELRGLVVGVGWTAVQLVDDQGATITVPTRWVAERPVRALRIPSPDGAPGAGRTPSGPAAQPPGEG